MHTPSTPEVKQPLSATDPRFSTSGILNAHLKEQNRQGLLSTYGGRTGQSMNINKFAEKKIAMRDPSAVPMLEQLAKLYSNVASQSKNAGVGNNNTSNYGEAQKNISEYNQSVESVNNFFEKYNLKNTNSFQKAGSVHNYDTRQMHSSNYGATNAAEISESANKLGVDNTQFNKVEEQLKKQKTSKPTK